MNKGRLHDSELRALIIKSWKQNEFLHIALDMLNRNDQCYWQVDEAIIWIFIYWYAYI